MFWQGNGSEERRNIPSVEVHGNLRAHCLYTVEVKVNKTKPLSLSHIEQHLTPRIHHQRVAIGFTAVGMLARLCCCDNKGCRFNSAGAEQDVPMRFASWHRERGRNCKCDRTISG